MSRINSRNKGARAELQAAKWLKLKFKLENEPQRNLEQVRSGGHDLNGFPPFCIEVKHCETLALRSWWIQAVASVTRDYSVPVVMAKQNRKPWIFLISAREIGLERGFIQLQENEFIKWINLHLGAQDEEI